MRISKAYPARRDRFWRVLHQLADQYRPQFNEAVLGALQQTRRASTYVAVQRALEAGDPESVVRILGLDDLEDALTYSIRDALRGLYGAAAAAAVRALPEKVGLRMSFDLLNPSTVDFLRTYELGLVKSVADSSKAALRDVLARAYVSGGTPAQIARTIRPMVGLLPRDSLAVGNYWAGLVEQGADLGKAERLAGDYAERLINQRADVIARTETIRAAGAGREAAWRQALEHGLLDPRRWRRYWLTTPDDRLCSACENIPLYNDEGVGFDELFETDGEPVMQEPLHPNCRCSIVIREVEPALGAIEEVA